MKTERILYCIFGLFLFTACSGGEDYEQQLEWFEEMNQKFQPIRSDSLIREVVEYYDHWWHSPYHRMRAYYMLGCAYRDMGNAPRALENYQKAASLADSTEGRFLPALMRIHSQMCGLYAQQRLKKEMLTESEIAARFAWKTGDSESALILESDYCHALYSDGMYEECIKEALELHAKFMEYGYRERALAVYANCVKSYLALKDYPHAKEYLDLYQTCSYFKDSPQKIHGGMSSLYLLKGQYYAGVGATDSAEYYFRKLLQQPDFENNQLLATKGLYQIYELKHNADSVLKYTRLYSDAKEYSFNETRAEALTQAKTMHDYSVEQQEAKEQAQWASQLTGLLVIATALIVAMAMLLLYYRRNKKRRITELIQRYQAAVQELHEAEEDLNAGNLKHAGDKNLIAAHEKKITELSAQVNTLIQTIRKIESEAEDYDLEKSKIVTGIMALRMQGKSISPEEWDALCKAVEERYPTFHEHMNSRQQLNETEYRVCLLLVSGFNPTDIEILMGKSNSFAAMTRKRLCIKVFGIEGKPQDFDRLLRQSYNNESSC